MLCLLLGSAVSHDRRADPVDAHVLRAAWLVMRPHFLADDGLLPGRGAATAEFVRPGDTQQSALGQQPAKLLRHLEIGRVIGECAQKILGDVLVHQIAQLLTQRARLWPELKIRDRSPSGPPSIDDDRLARDVPSRITDQPQHRADDVISSALDRQRRITAQVVGRALGVVQHVGDFAAKKPGATVLTRIECRAHCTARSAVSPDRPILLAAYDACGMPEMPTRPLIEETCTMAPLPASSMYGKQSCDSRNGATRLRSSVRRMSSTTPFPRAPS